MSGHCTLESHSLIFSSFPLRSLILTALFFKIWLMRVFWVQNQKKNHQKKLNPADLNFFN